LSEVLNSKVTSIEEGGFSRRRVVKGVAWSVPVVVTAIAAPAAAASGPTFSISFGPKGPITVVKANGSANPRNGQGPASLTFQNTSGAAVTGTVGIAPTGASTGTVRAGIAVKSLAGGSVGTPTFNASHASTASFTLTGSQPAERAITFYYVDGNGQSAPISGQIYTYTVTLTVGATTVVFPDLTMTIP
jgi:hypothetical protein